MQKGNWEKRLIWKLKLNNAGKLFALNRFLLVFPIQETLNILHFPRLLSSLSFIIVVFAYKCIVDRSKSTVFGTDLKTSKRLRFLKSSRLTSKIGGEIWKLTSAVQLCNCFTQLSLLACSFPSKLMEKIKRIIKLYSGIKFLLSTCRGCFNVKSSFSLTFLPPVAAI